LFFKHIFTQSLSIYIQQRPKCPQAHSTLIFDYISSAKMLILAILGQVGLSVTYLKYFLFTLLERVRKCYPP